MKKIKAQKSVLSCVRARGNKKTFLYLFTYAKRNRGEIRSKLIKLLIYRVCELSQIIDQ